jgi:hypothetical protein
MLTKKKIEEQPQRIGKHHGHPDRSLAENPDGQKIAENKRNKG